MEILFEYKSQSLEEYVAYPVKQISSAICIILLLSKLFGFFWLFFFCWGAGGGYRYLPPFFSVSSFYGLRVIRLITKI